MPQWAANVMPRRICSTNKRIVRAVSLFVCQSDNLSVLLTQGINRQCPIILKQLAPPLLQIAMQLFVLCCVGCQMQLSVMQTKTDHFQAKYQH